MVTASYVPLLVLVLARLAGASALTAANVGLVAAIVLLTFHGWLAGRAAQLHSWQLFFATSIKARSGDPSEATVTFSSTAPPPLAGT